MNIWQRLGFYMLGFSIGLVFVLFFLNKKGATCDYSPNARVKKNIRIKPKVYPDSIYLQMQKQQLDTTMVNYILHRGRVQFGESETRNEGCNRYVITGKKDNKNLRLTVKNCEEFAEIISFEKID